MNFFYDNLFSARECESLANEMFALQQSNSLALDNTMYTNGSMGAYNLQSTLDYANRIEQLIKKNYGNNIRFENTYSRIYRNGNDLKIHTDRPGLDITVSACLYSNLDFSWPIYVSNIQVNGRWDEVVVDPESYKNSYETFHTPVGSGIACLGTKSPHWRNRLICSPDQCMVQVFYHWSYI